MENEKPKVSVCIIAYNQANYIKATLEGILAQNCSFPIEIVIGEDCSLDNTRQICVEYKEKYPHIIRLLLPENNLGMYANLIQTIQSCTGKYIAFCEGDDYWIDPYKLQKQVDFLEANPDYGLVHTKHNIYHQQESRMEMLNQVKHTGDIFNQLLFDNEMATLTVVARTELIVSAIKEILIPAKTFKTLDYPMWLYVARYSKVHYLEDITAVYRKLEESASNTRDEIKSYLFIIGVCDIQVFFAEKYNCLSLIRDNVSAKKKRNLKYAYLVGNRDIADQAYFFLKKHNKLSLKDKLFYFSTTSAFMRLLALKTVGLKRLIGK